MNHTADFIVIGFGAAGGIVAKELAQAGFQVVVLEQDPYLREKTSKHDEQRNFLNFRFPRVSGA